MMKRCLVFFLTVLAAACSTGTTPGVADGTGGVSGKWQGRVGSDSSYLELTQSGTSVTGQACERPTSDCSPIQPGAKFEGSTLTAKYSFDERGKTETVELVLQLVEGGTSLTGKYNITKCSCSLDATLKKQ